MYKYNHKSGYVHTKTGRNLDLVIEAVIKGKMQSKEIRDHVNSTNNQNLGIKRIRSLIRILLDKDILVKRKLNLLHQRENYYVMNQDLERSEFQQIESHIIP